MDGDDAHAAQVWNLEHEHRISDITNRFMMDLGQKHNSLVLIHSDVGEAARAALKEMIEQTWSPKSDWLGRLRVPDGADTPDEMFTHIVASDLARYFPSAHISERDPPGRVELPRGFKVGPDGTPYARFIWLTFEPEGAAPVDDPTIVKCRLGLPHFSTDEYVFRIMFKVAHTALYVPTCLDAGLYEAWSPPPTDHPHPWGLTRDLRTGELGAPELLADAAEFSTQPPTALLVSPPGTRQSIRAVSQALFMVGRS